RCYHAPMADRRPPSERLRGRSNGRRCAARRIGPTLVVALAIAGCHDERAVGGLRLALLDPDAVLDHTAVVALSVYGEGASCSGATLVPGSGHAISEAARAFPPTASVTVQVPAGHRTFSLVAFADQGMTERVGEGCQAADLQPGETTTIEITLFEAP